MIWTPHVTVAAVLEQNGHFLAVEELINGQRYYNQPAGHLEAGESLLAAVVREVREETAYTFTPTHLLGIYHWQNPHNGITFVRFTFTGEISAYDSQQVLDKEIVATHWLSPAEWAACKAQHRSPLVQRGLDDYLAQRRYPLEILNFLA